ncbi:hypothetical protein DSL92_03880 [Billgrantia gudaonensis]|uniref:Uncharacterized protein n=1 Tax=Billgrantia gudaonensis TaxID=376427 RepID=A0A3S0NEY7_9GAMM|nr:hypothetical protein DSL92_03880 [Halomonas gudaonensis]
MAGAILMVVGPPRAGRHAAPSPGHGGCPRLHRNRPGARCRRRWCRLLEIGLTPTWLALGVLALAAGAAGDRCRSADSPSVPTRYRNRRPRARSLARRPCCW